MPIILDPNILYLVLLLGLWLGVTAAYVPGTGLLELMSAGITLVAVWLLASVQVSWVALAIVILGVAGFLIMPFIHQRSPLLPLGGLALQAIGSLFLLPQSPVSPVVIGLTILLALLYHHFGLRPALERSRATPITDEDEGLLGARGRVVTSLAPIGTVQVRGESWSARSDRTLSAGEEVVIVEREGLMLYVEPVKRKLTTSEPTQED